MQRLKKRFVLVLVVFVVVIPVVSLAIWRWPQKIPVDLISGEIYVGKMHFFVSTSDSKNPHIGIPDLNIQGTIINESSEDYQNVLSMMEEISYSNCFHTIFKPEDTHGEYDNEIRLSWTDHDGTPFDLYFFEGSNHIRINDKISDNYYHLITPSNPYQEWLNLRNNDFSTT